MVAGYVRRSLGRAADRRRESHLEEHKDRGRHQAGSRQRKGHHRLWFRSRKDVHLLESPTRGKQSGILSEHDQDTEMRDVESSKGHLRIRRQRPDRKDRVSGDASSAGHLGNVSVHLQGREGALPDTVRDRPGPVFSHDQRRGTQTRFSKAGPAALELLPGVAGPENENVGERHEHGDIPDRHREADQEQGEQARVLGRSGHRGRTQETRRQLQRRRLVSVAAILPEGRRASGGNQEGKRRADLIPDVEEGEGV